METARVVEVLAGTALVEGLEPDDVRRLAEAGELRQASGAETLMEEGSPGSALFVILDGEVEVLKRRAQGERHRLVTLGEGAVLGEIGLVLGEPSSATVRTTRPTSLFVLERKRFEELVGRGDAAAVTLTLSLAKVLATRLRRMNEEAVELCERYEEVLAAAGESGRSPKVRELARFREQLLSEWNF